MKPLSKNKRNMQNSKIYLLLFFIYLITYSCVPTRQFQELKEKNKLTVTERDSIKNLNEEFTVSNTEMEAEIDELTKKLKELAENKNQIKDSATFYKKQYKVFKTMYSDLSETQNTHEKLRDEETRKLLAELQVSQEDLQLQEDELRQLEQRLMAKEAELNGRDEILIALDSALNIRQLELDEKNKRVKELEQILHSKDSAVLALKSKITNALLGFENKGLTIHQKNGKVYVTMENKLVFKSGKWNVDSRGKEALLQIAKVLEQNSDINILVEGHTDDQPMAGTGDIKDNWDLSVKRATAIVKIILNNSKIKETRITAAGRGPFMPLDLGKTAEARAKNRRTEIILTPKLDKLFQLLEAN